ncbi:MAG: hypothetical protein L6Q71_10665 [Planctomycetes bacterium]|nr:hypothetical protein [Planctomycetota bacterium]NUQ33926.1 helix-turn-helix domain-containing protein [Planctomycetaceae bacterium]
MVEYESFEDVLNDLNIDESDLKRLVSEGALRAYRDEDRMKFRRDDIDSLKISGGRLESLAKGTKERGASDAEIQSLSEADALEVVEDTDETLVNVGDLSGDVDFEDTGATSVPTVELDIGGEADATLTDELVFEDIEGGDAGGADATLAMDGMTLGDDDLGLETEPLAGPDADATMIESGDEITLSADDEITLTGDEGLDMTGGSAVRTGLGQQTALGQTSMGSFATMAPPPMMAPQIQVQEKVKYIEILPSEPVWTKIIAGFFLAFMFVVALATLGGRAKDEFFGIASFGYGMVSKPAGMKEKTELSQLPLRPSSGSTPIPPSDPGYYSPEHWLVVAGSGEPVAPGMELIRKPDGRFGASVGREEFRKPEATVTRENMAQELKDKGAALDKLRRAYLQPASRPSSSSSTPAPAPEPTPAPVQ